MSNKLKQPIVAGREGVGLLGAGVASSLSASGQLFALRFGILFQIFVCNGGSVVAAGTDFRVEFVENFFDVEKKEFVDFDHGLVASMV